MRWTLTLTFDLDFQSQMSYGHDPHINENSSSKNSRFKRQSGNRRTLLIVLLSRLTQSVNMIQSRDALDTGRRCTRQRCPAASCGRLVPVDHGSSRVLQQQRRAAPGGPPSRADRRGGHIADSSRRRRGRSTDSRPAAAGS